MLWGYVNHWFTPKMSWSHQFHPILEHQDEPRCSPQNWKVSVLGCFRFIQWVLLCFTGKTWKDQICAAFGPGFFGSRAEQQLAAELPWRCCHGRSGRCWGPRTSWNVAPKRQKRRSTPCVWLFDFFFFASFCTLGSLQARLVRWI